MDRKVKDISDGIHEESASFAKSGKKNLLHYAALCLLSIPITTVPFLHAANEARLMSDYVHCLKLDIEALSRGQVPSDNYNDEGPATGLTCDEVVIKYHNK
jgi:hypothetical protein